jgi:dTMP kinase
MKFSQPEPLTELLLYAADRAQHVEEVLKPQLAAGAIILCDRYINSTIAYQGYGRGFSLDLIDQLNFIATGGLESDLTLWLDVDVEVGLERTKTRGVVDRIEQAGLEFHERVQQGYTQLAKAQPQQIVRVDANLSEAAVQEQIQQILVQRLTEWGLGVRVRVVDGGWMNFFAQLIGQEQAIELLTQAVSQNRVAPAYLFAGPDGVGKSLAARCFIQQLFYSNVPNQQQQQLQNACSWAIILIYCGYNLHISTKGRDFP